MTAVCSLSGEQGIYESRSKETWLWSKCCSDKSSWFDRSFSAAAVEEERHRTTSSSGHGSWHEGGAEAMLDVSTSIAKCFLVPVWWGSSSSGMEGGRFLKQHDGVQKHLVLSHGVNGPSARIVLWRNYMGFDCKGARRNLGALIRAHNASKKISEIEEVESDNQSFLGSMLGTALSKYVKSQLDHCGQLDVRVAGSNRDILRGQLKRVKISAKQVIYKGVALSDVDLSARSIQITVGKRRVLQDPVQVKALISICERDLKASLASPLLADYLKDLLPEALRGDRLAGVQVGMKDGVVHLTEGKELKLGPNSNHNKKMSPPSVALSFALTHGGRTVLINHAGECERQACGTSFDVGSETSLSKLGVINSKLVIGGDFYITPS